jgi:hypothetical protein
MATPPGAAAGFGDRPRCAGTRISAPQAEPCGKLGAISNGGPWRDGPRGYSAIVRKARLVQTFRSYLASARGEKNWFVALSDPRLSRAIGAMQLEHARSWSLDDLARTAGLSLAGFALSFK